MYVYKNGKFQRSTDREGPEMERRYISTHSLSSALDGGELLTRSGRFIPGNVPISII